MSGTNRERLAEIAAAASILAVIAAAITLGVLFLSRMDLDLFSARMVPLAVQSLGQSGERLAATEIPNRGFRSVRRAVVFRNKSGAVAGAGFSMSLEIQGAALGVFLITDEKGRVHHADVWPGVSGLRAEELRTYLKHRGKGTTGGLDPAVDLEYMEFSVHEAMEEASSFFHSWKGMQK